MKRWIPILLCAALLLSGCGSVKGDASNSYEMAYETAAYDNGIAAEAAAPMAAQTASGTTGAELPQNRKFIITLYLNAETEELDTSLTAVNESLKAQGGYVESQNIYNGSSYSGRRYRSAELTLRIPAENLEGFTQAVEGATNVVSSSRSTEDVTLQYVDTESRVTALKTEQERLLELLGQADNMSDLLEIESRLTDVRGELERYASKLKVLENQVDYATVNLSISEVKEYTPVVEKTRLEKIAEGFLRSVKDLGNGILDFFAALIIDLPYLVVFGLVLFAAVKLFGRIRKKRVAKKQKKADAESN